MDFFSHILLLLQNSLAILHCKKKIPEGSGKKNGGIKMIPVHNKILKNNITK